MRERNVEICKNLKIRELEYEFKKCIIKWIKQCINIYGDSRIWKKWIYKLI